MTFEELVCKAREAVEAMTPEQRREMYREQARSFVRGEAGMGSDADEAEYAEALRAGDKETLARLDAEAAERVRRAEEVLDRQEPSK